jgi:cytochrome c
MKTLLLSVLLVSGMATAQADQALATKNNCMACHAVDKKLVGPSYRDVAKKYAGVAGDKVSALAVSIKKGGAGKWGSIPMPAQPQLSETDAKKLAAWILETK